MVDHELESFKNIDLRAYAAGQGYQLGKDSWRGSAVMRNPSTNDKVIIKRDMDGHHVYFSVRDDRDNGSIIDWVQNRNRGMSLGAVRKELRPWIGTPPVNVPSFPPLPKTTKDRMKVEAAYARMQDASIGHPYLERDRAIPAPHSRSTVLQAGSASMIVVMRFFRISIRTDCAAMKSKIPASLVSLLAA